MATREESVLKNSTRINVPVHATSRAERILQNSMKINRRNRLQNDRKKVEKWLEETDGGVNQPRRSSRQPTAPGWHQFYTSDSKSWKQKVNRIHCTTPVPALDKEEATSINNVVAAGVEHSRPSLCPESLDPALDNLADVSGPVDGVADDVAAVRIEQSQPGLHPVLVLDKLTDVGRPFQQEATLIDNIAAANVEQSRPSVRPDPAFDNLGDVGGPLDGMVDDVAAVGIVQSQPDLHPLPALDKLADVGRPFQQEATLIDNTAAAGVEQSRPSLRPESLDPALDNLADVGGPVDGVADDVAAVGIKQSQPDLHPLPALDKLADIGRAFQQEATLIDNTAAAGVEQSRPRPSLCPDPALDRFADVGGLDPFLTRLHQSPTALNNLADVIGPIDGMVNGIAAFGVEQSQTSLHLVPALDDFANVGRPFLEEPSSIDGLQLFELVVDEVDFRKVTVDENITPVDNQTCQATGSNVGVGQESLVQLHVDMAAVDVTAGMNEQILPVHDQVVIFATDPTEEAFTTTVDVDELKQLVGVSGGACTAPVSEAKLVTKKERRRTPRKSTLRAMTASASKNSRKSTAKTVKKRPSTEKKCTTVAFVNLPSGSEDSELSSSDDETFHDVTQHRLICDEQQGEAASLKKGISRVVWKTGSLTKSPESVKFLGDLTASHSETSFDHLQTPVEYFRHFFTADVFQLMSSQTALYSAQQRTEKPIKIAVPELEQFAGICLYMSLVRMPNTRSYWSSEFRVNQIADIMTLNRFEEIKRFLHFADNDAEVGTEHDRLAKIRPLLDLLRTRFRTVPMEEHLSVDEQIVPFKGRSGLKQYNPMKPHKWGYKMWVLCGASGFAYDLECYTGKGDNKLLSEEQDCGASGNVVIRLSRSVPSNANFKLYFDNYFNSPKLQVFLAKRGIFSLGTIRSNRVPQCAVASDVELKKRGRGSFDEKTTVIDAVELTHIRWYDNKSVNLLSTFVGSDPVSTVLRWNRQEKKYCEVPSPHVVQAYNKHMGGVDLQDSLIGLYRCRLRSKKWYHRLWLHLLDLTVVNSWLLYKRQLPMSSSDHRKPIRLYEFKASVAQALCKEGKEVTKKRGRRPSADSGDPTPVKRRAPKSVLPPTNVQCDGVGHWPKWGIKQERCKRQACTGKSRVSCSKCQVALCFHAKQDCFYEFHKTK